MDQGQAESSKIVTSKSFLAIGPTLHYSHNYVRRYWLLALLTFAITSIFFSKILTGSFWSFSIATVITPNLWHLGQVIKTGVSIYEYPSQIAILGLLMGVLAIGPVLISQLLSFPYSIPFILAVFFLANLPGLAIALVISCVAVACRPLRFRSRFISVALCTAPQLIYWGYFGITRGVGPIEWGFSFTPWLCAWLFGLSMAAIVLGVGHYTRYKPGLVWVATTVVFLIAVSLFEGKISFAELDYQLYIANNNPEQISQFHDHSITDALDRTIKNPSVKKYLLAGFFYPTEPIALRAKLKEKIQTQLGLDRWPNWFVTPAELQYQPKREQLMRQYDLFITRRSKSARMPIALYYKALLSDYSPDIKLFGQKEILHFYSDYPFERSREIWYRLYTEFGKSPESIEARWRIAKHWAGQGQFEQADELLGEADSMAMKILSEHKDQQPQDDSFLRSFHPAADSVMTKYKLTLLRRRIHQLRNLISKENRTAEPLSVKRLAIFVMLNPHEPRFTLHLDGLLGQLSDDDPLRDNVLLAQTKLIADEHLRAEKLTQLHLDYKGADGAMQALYELAYLKICIWQQNEVSPEQKKKDLAGARGALAEFISLYPDSIFTDHAKKILAELPTVE